MDRLVDLQAPPSAKSTVIRTMVKATQHQGDGAANASLSRYVFAGLCASLVGIGLARFAYTPLIPPLIEAHWFAPSDVVYLGAANLAGYLFGAVLGRPIGSRIGNVRTLRSMMVLVTLAFIGCAFPLSMLWFFAWRLLSGIAGGAIMVLVASTLLPHVRVSRKGVASGAIFLSIGLGVAISGTVVPTLLGFGLRATWIGLGVLSGVLTAASWLAWPSPSTVQDEKDASANTAVYHPPTCPSINLLYFQYALMAFGVVAPMVFWVDFIARGVGAGAHVGSVFWIVYGVGAIFGPPLYGALADRIGSINTMRLILMVQSIALSTAYFASNFAMLAVLTVIVGTFPSGIVPLVLSRIHSAIPHSRAKQNIAWGRATTVFAAAQAIAGYAYSGVFDMTGGHHRVLFLAAGAAVAFALAVDLGSHLPFALKERRRSKSAAH